MPLMGSGNPGPNGTDEPSPKGDAVVASLNLAAAIAKLIFVTLVAGVVVYACSSANNDHKAAGDTTNSPTTTATPPESIMLGNGTYNMGGIDGKYWGIWSTGPVPSRCVWSIVAQSGYSPASVLDHGISEPGEIAQVNIQPLGDSSALTGESHGIRLRFITSGCGTWRLMD